MTVKLISSIRKYTDSKEIQAILESIRLLDFKVYELTFVLPILFSLQKDLHPDLNEKERIIEDIHSTYSKISSSIGYN